MSRKNPQYLDLNLTRKLLEDVDTFLFDFDGVICAHQTPILGSVKCVNRLMKMGKNCFFVSNNSTKTREEFVTLLTKLGIENVTIDSIMCPSWVLAGYLKSIGFKDKVYVIGSESIGHDLDKENIAHTGIGPVTQVTDPGNFNFNDLELDRDVKCVVVAFDYYFNYAKIVLATTYAYREGCHFLATHNDPLYNSPNARVVIPGTGTLVNSVATSVGRQPLVLGKPFTTMWDILSSKRNLDARRTCMIGDNLFTDIEFAHNCKLGFSLAVFTGVTNESEILKYASSSNESDQKYVPTFYTDGLAKFDSLIGQLKQ